MIRALFASGNVRNIQSAVSKSQKIAKCLVCVHRYTHEGGDSLKVKNSLEGEKEPSKIREKHAFNANAVMDLCLEKFDDDLLYFPEILDKNEWIRLIDWGNRVEKDIHGIKYDEIISSDKITADVLDKLKSLRIFGKQIPKKYGGLELTETENTYIQEILGLVPSVARMVAENEEMGIKALVKYGTVDQKEKYLPKLANGDMLISFAYMEDSSSLMDCKSYIGLEAAHCEDKFILNGRKKWVYNAKDADLFIVLGTESVADDKGAMLLNTLFFVEKNAVGLRINPPMKKNWFRGLEVCEVVFDEVIVGHESILGGYGKGFELFQDIVRNNRTSIIAECTTALKRLFHDAVNKSKNNSFLNKPISSFQYCEYALGELACLSYAVESLTYYLASRADYYENPDLAMEVYMAKVFAADTISEALQLYFNLLGKNGYTKGSFVEELVQNAHYYSILDDTGFDLRLFIISNTIHYLGKQLAGVVKQLADPGNNPYALIKYYISQNNQFEDKAKPRLDLSMCVHRCMSLCADDLEYCLNRLKYTYEKELHKFGNNIVKNDYDLLLLSEMLINTYALIACIARASRAGFLNLPDVELEVKLAFAFSTRTVTKIKSISNLIGRNEEELETCAKIGRKVINEKEYMVEHPLMRNF